MEKNQPRIPFIFTSLPLFLMVIFLVSLFTFLIASDGSAASGSLLIDGGKATTKERQVTLTLDGPTGVKKMKISNVPDLKGAEWESYKKKKQWYLEYGSGTKTVYVKFSDKKGVVTVTVSDTIVLSVPAQMNVDFSINASEKATQSRYVLLSVTSSEGVESVAISNTSDFSIAVFEKPEKEIPWILSSESGKKTVSLMFKDGNNKTKTIVKTIEYIEKVPHIEEGSVIGALGVGLYFVGFDGRLHPFLNHRVYHSWHQGFENIQFVSGAKINEYQIGDPVCFRPGTWLVKLSSSSKIYAVEPGCQLRPLLSGVEAALLYGNDWEKRVVEIDSIEAGSYTLHYPSFSDGFPSKSDKDKDGLDEDVENLYDSSDTDSDSDNDEVSDFEEIAYWLSDPASSDTDGDGIEDGKEIMSGTSPVGIGPLTALPVGTYTYPGGSLVYDTKKNSWYYYHSNGFVYATSPSVGGEPFASTPLYSSAPLNTKGAISASEQEVKYPSVLIKNHVVAM